MCVSRGVGERRQSESPSEKQSRVGWKRIYRREALINQGFSPPKPSFMAKKKRKNPPFLMRQQLAGMGGSQEKGKKEALMRERRDRCLMMA